MSKRTLLPRGITRILKPLAITAGMAVLAVWASGFLREKTPPGRVELVNRQVIPESAELFTISKESLAAPIDVVGTTSSERSVQISARMSAHVIEVLVSAGDRVEKGQALLRLDDRGVQEQIAESEAVLRGAEAEFKRTKRLFESQAATEQAMTAAESAFHAARSRVEQARIMLTYAEIASPMSGIVTDRRVEEGDVVGPGRVLLSVYDPERMRLEAHVPLRLVDLLQLEQAVQVRLDRPAEPFAGRVTEIVSEVDPRSRTQKVRIRLELSGAEVLPGTFGRATVEGPARACLLVPQSAVYRIGQLSMVQVVRGGHFVRRAVKTGAMHGERIEILSGVADGEKLLVHPVLEA